MSYFIYGNVESFFFCMLVQFFFVPLHRLYDLP
jgi:hypothetical protein